RNVLPTGDDDVFEAVHQLNVSVWVLYPDVTGVEPASGKRFLGGFGVLVVPRHDAVTSNDDFALSFAVGRQLIPLGVDNCHLGVLEHRHTLTGQLTSTLCDSQLSPVILRFINGGRAVGFG